MEAVIIVFILTSVVFLIGYATRKDNSVGEKSENKPEVGVAQPITTVIENKKTISEKEYAPSTFNFKNLVGFCLAFTYCAFVFSLCINNVTINHTLNHKGNVSASIKHGGLYGAEIGVRNSGR